nr:hypothetical protein [Buchnera aphidicola]
MTDTSNKVDRSIRIIIKKSYFISINENCKYIVKINKKKDFNICVCT